VEDIMYRKELEKRTFFINSKNISSQMLEKVESLLAKGPPD